MCSQVSVFGLKKTVQTVSLTLNSLKLTDKPDHDQIVTMQYGQCGEGALPINFPLQLLSDGHGSSLLAHQFILYRYGVFNEHGYINDERYPVYYQTPGELLVHNTSQPLFTACAHQNRTEEGNNGNGTNIDFNTMCSSLDVNPVTGKPLNLNCDVIPLEKFTEFSFMYNPLGEMSSLCTGREHDRLSPNKQNVLCDYRSSREVIDKHVDFER